MGSDSIYTVIPLLSPHALYRAIDKNEQQRHNAYCVLFKAAMEREMVDEIRECTNKGWALGGGRFQSKIEHLPSAGLNRCQRAGQS